MVELKYLVISVLCCLQSDYEFSCMNVLTENSFICSTKLTFLSAGVVLVEIAETHKKVQMELEQSVRKHK